MIPNVLPNKGLLLTTPSSKLNWYLKLLWSTVFLSTFPYCPYLQTDTEKEQLT